MAQVEPIRDHSAVTDPSPPEPSASPPGDASRGRLSRSRIARALLLVVVLSLFGVGLVAIHHLLVTKSVTYPDATAMPGVVVSTEPQAKKCVNSEGFHCFDQAFGLDSTLPKRPLVPGRAYSFAATVDYTGDVLPDDETLVVTISAINGVLAGPRPFLIRVGHDYTIPLVLTPNPGHGSVTVQLCNPAGCGYGGPTRYTVPFQAASGA